MDQASRWTDRVRLPLEHALGRGRRGQARPSGTQMARGIATGLVLGGLNLVALAILATRTLRPDPDLAVVAVLGAAVLFAVAEAATVRLEIGGVAMRIGLRSTPLLIGLVFASPVEVIAAQVVGMSAGLLLGREPMRTAVPVVAIGAMATAVAVVAFGAVLGDASRGGLPWWPAALVAAEILALGCALAALLVPQGPRSLRSLAVTFAFVSLAAAVDASLGMTVVVFLSTEPAELWLLVGPMIVAVATYRAWGRLRRRQARFELLYACAQVLDGPATATAMLTNLLERARTSLRADTAEILLEEPTGGTLRAAVGLLGTVEPLTVVPPATIRQRRGLVPVGTASALLRRGARTISASRERDPALADGIVVRFDRPASVSGTMTVAGRGDGRAFDAEDRSLLEAIAGVVADALAGERMTEELAASRAELHHLAALVAGSDDAIVGLDRDGLITNWNPAAAALFGEPADEVVGRPAAMLAIADASTSLSQAFRRACEGELTRDVLVDARRADGTVVPVSATVSPVRASGVVVGVSVIARDETARALEDTAIREGLDRFESAFDGSPVGMGVIDADFQWVRVNESLCRPLGVPEAALVGRRFELALVREDIEAAHGLVSRVLRGEIAASSAEVRFRGGGTTPVVATLAVRPLRIADQAPQVLCTVEDITERRAAEARARAAMARVQQAAVELTRIRLPEDVLRAALRAAREASGAACAAVRLPGPSLGLRLPLIGDDDGTGLLAVLAEEEALLILDADQLPTRHPSPDRPSSAVFASERLHSFLSVPFPLDDGTTGALMLLNKQDAAEFGDEDVEAAEALALQAGISYGNALVHERALALVRELDMTNEALRAATAARLRFLASVSHELRNPLHAILLAARLLVDPEGTPEDVRRRAETLPRTIEASGHYLVGLIDDLIELSRLEVAQQRIEPIELDLGPLLTGVHHQLAALAEAQGVRLEVPTDNRLAVRADPLRLHQVLINLVSNGIKYTPTGGSVEVAVGLVEGEPTIRVSDSGIGMNPNDIERAFEPFERLARDAAHGAGLGLPIARRIVELHGGTLTATSQLGIGSTFTVRLPASTVVQPIRAAERLPAGPPTRRRDRPTVLLVDDDPDARDLTSQLLHGAGHEVLSAASLREARDQLRVASPRLVVLDLQLGDGDGLELLGDLCGGEAPRVPVVTVSAAASPGDEARALAAGAARHLRKPIDPVVLVGEISGLVAAAPSAARRKRRHATGGG